MIGDRNDRSGVGHVRRLLRRLYRAALSIARRGPLRARLSRLPFTPLARRLFRGLEVVSWRGVRVAVDPGEAHGYHVYFLGDYARSEIEACINQCRTARIFVDVGANIGLVTLAVARACPRVRVIAFEPDRAVAVWLRHNLSLNPDLASRVRIVEAAVASDEGHARFVSGHRDDNIGLGRLDDSGETGVRVSTVALGPFATRERLTFDTVKIDVEGTELDVLRGLWRSQQRPRAIVVETHAGHNLGPIAVFNRQIIDELTGAGYRIARLARGRWVPLDTPEAMGRRAHLLAVQQRSDVASS